MTDDFQAGKFEHGLRGALTGATTGLPDNPSRYEETEVRVRRGRRRAGIAVVATVVVLVVAGIAVPQLIRPGGGGSDDGLLARTGDVTNLSCPEPSSPGAPKATGRGPLVPEGAVSARFCPGKPASPYAPKSDPKVMRSTITYGVDRLVSRLNLLEPAESDPTCTDELGPTYNLVLGYPDGSQRLVTFEEYGCGVAKSGSEYRMGARALADVGEQLLNMEPDATLPCPTGNKPVDAPPVKGAGGPLVPEGANAARLCARKNPAGGDTGLSQVVFDQANAKKLTVELNALKPVDPNTACTMELGTTYDLVLGYPDGRQIVTTFEGFSCGYAQSGKAFRQGANRLPEVAAGLAEQQRLAIRPPSAPAAPECPRGLESGEALLRGQLYDSYTRDPGNSVPQPAVAGRVCRFDAKAGLQDQQALSPAQAESLRTLVNQSAKDRTSSCDPTSYAGPVDVILLTDRAGGRYELRVLPGCTTLLDVNGIAKASPALLERIDEIFQ